MKSSNIGGQAVIEGVMMKNQEKYAVAVRKPDHEIEVKVSEYTGIIRNKKIRNMPILRGVFSFYRVACTRNADIDLFRFFF